MPNNNAHTVTGPLNLQSVSLPLAAKPTQPAITVDPIGQSTARVSLATPSSFAFTYTIRYRQGTGSYTYITGLNAGAFPYDITGLTGGQSYGVSVVGINSFGAGAYSSEQTVTLGSGTGWTSGAPVISGISGSWGQGNTLTISASNLSVARNGQQIYANFDSGTNGASAATVLPAYDNGGHGTLDYLITDTDSFSGTKSARLTFPVGPSSGFFPGVDLGASSQKEVFFHARVKYHKVTEGNDLDGGRQIKTFRIIGGSAAHTITPYCGTTWDINYGNIQAYQDPGTGLDNWWGQPPALDTWHEVWMYCKLSSVPGVADGARFIKAYGQEAFTKGGETGHFASPDNTTPATSWNPQDNLVTLGATAQNLQGFDRVLFPFFKRESMAYDIYVDQIFVNDSLECVIAGDAPTWAACAKRVVQPMTTRTGSGLTVTCEAGNLTGTPYIYVMNRDGSVNANGVQPVVVQHGDIVTITGSGFGTRTNVKPLFVNFGSTKAHSSLGRLTGSYWNSGAYTSTTKSLGQTGGSVGFDLGTGVPTGYSGSIYPNYISFPSDTTPQIVYLERYYDFDPYDNTNWDPNGMGLNLKTNRCFSQGTGAKTNWYVGSNPNNGPGAGAFIVEYVSNNVNKYYSNTPLPFQWLSEEFLFKQSSAAGVRDGRLLHYRNAALLNTLTVDQDATTFDSDVANGTNFRAHHMVFDQMSNNDTTRPLSVFYNYALLDDEYNAVYIGDAPTWAACTRRVRMPQTAWDNEAVSFVALETAVPLTNAYAYVRTGEETWASDNGIPSTSWSVS